MYSDGVTRENGNCMNGVLGCFTLMVFYLSAGYLIIAYGEMHRTQTYSFRVCLVQLK